MSENPKERWEAGGAYERYVGRWSRMVATEFLAWLSVPAHREWVDVGCGTGGLVATILQQGNPHNVIGIDRSKGFLAEAQRTITDRRVRFQVGDAMELPLETATCDVAVSGLVLNFVPDPPMMVREMVRVTKLGGKVAVYVWDYAEGMEMMRHFWDAAIAVSPHAPTLDESERFPICQPTALGALWQEVGLTDVTVRAIEIPTVFQDFEDFWSPFLGQQGSAPTYLASVDSETRERIREHLHSHLVPAADGTITLSARAWAVQGTVA